MTPMRGLDALQSTARGRDFLLSHGVHTNRAAFREALSPPADGRLASTCGAADDAFVHMHQQIYPDHRPSVLGKIMTLDALAERGVHPAFLWIDTHRAASDKLACRFYWPHEGALRTAKVTPPGSEAIETRYVRVDPPRTAEAWRRIAGYVRQDKEGPLAPHEQLARLTAMRPHMVAPEPLGLADYGLGLTRALLRRQLGIGHSEIIVSDVIERGWLTVALEDMLDVLPDVIATFSDRVTSLRAEGIDSAVGVLPPDYLPLYFSDPADGARLRLRHRIDGADHYAVAEAKSGRTYKFFLGTRRLRIDALAATRRWSPDVTLPMLANALFSGWVAGKSSALYALVFREVLATVLGQKPIPILVPPRIAAGASTAASLLHAYVTGAALAGPELERIDEPAHG